MDAIEIPGKGTVLTTRIVLGLPKEDEAIWCSATEGRVLSTDDVRVHACRTGAGIPPQVGNLTDLDLSVCVRGASVVQRRVREESA